jgi:Cof subfamily protein (haloacid dehalogenase superfamily)
MVLSETLFISDLDGTLLTPEARVSPYARGALNAMLAGGLQFSVATARATPTAAKILEGLALTLPAAMMNGALLYDLGAKRAVGLRAMPPDAAGRLAELLERQGAEAFLYGWRDEQLTAYHPPLASPYLRAFVAERVQEYGNYFREVKRYTEAPLGPVVYAALLGPPERLAALGEALKLPGLGSVLYSDVYRPGLWWLEVFSDQVSKYQAAQDLKAAYGFKTLVGFGDNLNDLPLFNACDYRLAVGNAHPQVKAAADAVIGTNEADGVVRWLEGHV